MMRALAVATVLFVGCGKKNEKPPAATGSAAQPTDSSAAVSADGGSFDSAPAGSADGSAAGSAAATTGAAGSGAIDLCALAKQEDIEKAIGPISGPVVDNGEASPKKLPPGATGVVGCEIMLANRDITVEAEPTAEFDALVDKKHSKPLKNLGEKAYANDHTGVIVQPAGKPFFIHIKSDAGGPDDDTKMYENHTAEALARVLVSAMK